MIMTALNLLRGLHCGRVQGHIAIATDVCGNFLTFNPADAEEKGERPIYYVCHDPPGCGRVAASFDEFLTRAGALGWYQDELVADLPETFVALEFPKAGENRTARRWWKFW